MEEDEVEILIPGKSLIGFRTAYKTEVDITYTFQRKNVLIATVDDCCRDSFETEALLLFLKEKGVIQNVEEWKVSKIEDTDGLTYMDEDFTTVIFGKSRKRR